MQDDGRHRVVSAPVRGQQLRVRIEHPQAVDGAVVEVIQIRIPAEHQEQALGSEAGAQIDLRSRQLAPAGAHANHQRMGQALREHRELQALAGIAAAAPACGGGRSPAAGRATRRRR